LACRAAAPDKTAPPCGGERVEPGVISSSLFITFLNQSARKVADRPVGNNEFQTLPAIRTRIMNSTPDVALEVEAG